MLEPLGRFAAMKVLIVDDNRASVDLLRALLEDNGLRRITTETDPRRVAALLPEVRPDLVLLDLVMPHVGGLQLLGEIKWYADGRYLPVLVLTADSATEIRDLALERGARDFLTKPIDTVEVILRIANLLETRQLYADLARQGADLAEQDIRVRRRTSEVSAAKKMVAQQTTEVARSGKERDRATEASHSKSDFLANMSHEIRTPMNGVIGMIDLLLETPLTAQQQDYAETVRDSGSALLRIVDDILDFSKIEAGRLTVEEIELDVRRSMDGVARLLSATALAKGLTFTLVVDPAVPATVYGDPGRLRQVLTNFIGNAIKFTSTGGIVVTVALDEPVSDLERGDTLRFTIADTGPGLSAHDLTKIFAPFVQADASTSRRYGGTGLGLAINRQLVELMGGSCGAESTLGVGSEFWFTVRVDRTAGQSGGSGDSPTTTSEPEQDVMADNDEARSLGAAAAARPNGAARRGVILLAEDNAINQKVALAMLTAAGYEVDTASDGVEAVHAAATRQYDSILMDCQMPELSGFEATAAIREHEGSDCRTPIIAMTAAARTEDRDLCLASGMDGYVSKPVSKEALVEAIDRSIALRGAA